MSDAVEASGNLLVFFANAGVRGSLGPFRAFGTLGPVEALICLKGFAVLGFKLGFGVASALFGPSARQGP